MYGGAGVHVEFLARELRPLVDLEVHCWGEGRTDGVLRHRPWSTLDGSNDALRTFAVDLAMAAALQGRELVHSHTWYANLGGHLAKLLSGAGPCGTRGRRRTRPRTRAVHVHVGRGAVVRGAVLDKNVEVPPGATIGVNPERDADLYTVSKGGVIALGKGQRVS